MMTRCSECAALEQDRHAASPHRGLVETAPVGAQDAAAPDARVPSFMCLGCGLRWRLDPQQGWQQMND